MKISHKSIRHNSNLYYRIKDIYRTFHKVKLVQILFYDFDIWEFRIQMVHRLRCHMIYNENEDEPLFYLNFYISYLCNPH